MAALPTGRAGQGLAVAILLLAMVTVWLAVVAPLLDLYADRAETLVQRDTLARRMAQVAADLPALERASAAVPATGPVAPALLQGGSDGVAGAALQQMVQEMATRAGATLSSTEALPGEAAAGYRVIGVRAALAAPWPVLVQVLRSVAEASPRLLVDDLHLRGGRRFGGVGDPPMDMSLVVLGFRAALP